MYVSSGSDLGGSNVELDRVCVRHPGEVNLDALEEMAHRTGNFLLGSPETYGVRVISSKDISVVKSRFPNGPDALLAEINDFAHNSLGGLDKVPVDKVKVVARSSVFNYVRVGLDDHVLPYFDDELRRFYEEFDARNFFKPKRTFPFGIVAVRAGLPVEPIKEELDRYFCGSSVALRGAEIEVI